MQFRADSVICSKNKRKAGFRNHLGARTAGSSSVTIYLFNAYQIIKNFLPKIPKKRDGCFRVLC